jgi:hypothetical protein
MCMQPNAAELFGAPAEVDLILEVVRDGFIIKGYADSGDILLDRHEVFYQQRVVDARDTKPADLRSLAITEVE